MSNIKLSAIKILKKNNYELKIFLDFRDFMNR